MRIHFSVITQLMMLNCSHLMAQTTHPLPVSRHSQSAQTTVEPRYSIHRTENNWTFIELDTQTGRLWQLQYSTDPKGTRGKAPINNAPLALNGRNGRFSLTPTNNMWNFILLDQDTGRTWQAQFSMEEQNRGIFLILSEEELTSLLKK